MAVKLWALRIGRPLHPGRLLVLISVRAWVDPRAIIRLEGLGLLKNSMTSTGIVLATFWLVAQLLHPLLYRVRPQVIMKQAQHVRNVKRINHFIYLNVNLGITREIKVWIATNKTSLFPLSLSLSMTLRPFRSWWFFSFLIICAVGRTPWTGDQPVARTLPTYRTIQTWNKRTQKLTPRVGFETITSVFERAKKVHILDRAATVIGLFTSSLLMHFLFSVYL
jgi:hypothetical protein